MNDKTNPQEDEIEIDDEAVNKEITPPSSDTTELQKELEEYKSGWQRATADYRNLVKEVDAKRGELVAWSEQMILEEFIPVFANFRKAFASKNGSWNTDQENWVKGIEYIMKQFEQIMKQHGVEEIDAIGKVFDPTKHEAVGEEECDDADENTVLKIMDPGFTMRGKVIKVAKVIICKK